MTLKQMDEYIQIMGLEDYQQWLWDTYGTNMLYEWRFHRAKLSFEYNEIYVDNG